MKLDVNFSQLYSSVRKMGINEFVNISISLNSPPIEIPIETISTTKGIEVPINEVKIDSSTGIFIYQEKHVILFIPDHSYKYELVLQNPKKEGNRYHLTECTTLSAMRAKGRFKRYFATTNKTGIFEIFNDSGDRNEVPLSVCKWCLTQLNYKNYTNNRNQVFNEFTLAEFFTYYETKFSLIPENIGQNNGGYTEDWDIISRYYRQSVKFSCENCGVNLTKFPYLLDTHHKNGVKQDNRSINLKALCKICHSLEPEHNHLIVSDRDRQQIKHLRYSQNIFID